MINFELSKAEKERSEQVKPVFHYFVGIDVSKDKLDGALIMQGRLVKSFQVANARSGFTKLGTLIKSIPGYQSDKIVVCMESTSIYHLELANYLSHQKLAVVWVENATQIKRSMGIRRGQNDKADAKNIGEYAYRHQDKLAESYRVYKPLSPVFSKLKSIQKHREKLLKIKLQLKNEQSEYQSMGFMKTSEMREIALMKEAMNARILAEIETSIKECEARLRAIIKEDEAIKKQFDLITTVEGVGLLVGVYLIVATRNFQSFTNARKFACQIGIAPFKKVSGSSVSINKGVSHFADKYGKKMITNAVGCAIRRYGGLRTYYERKVGEGKQEGKVLNACKNKLLHRIFAVVKSGVPYDRFHVWEPNSQ